MEQVLLILGGIGILALFGWILYDKIKNPSKYNGNGVDY